MADEEEEESSSQQETPGSLAGGLVPENVPTGMRAEVGKIAKEALLGGMKDVVTALLFNVKEKNHLPSLKLLSDLTNLVADVEDVRLVNYAGFAVELKVMAEKLRSEQTQLVAGAVELPENAEPDEEVE